MSDSSVDPPARSDPDGLSHRLKELAFLFLKLGTVSFGGPAVHIAVLQDEVVRRRQWVTHDEFLDMMGATNLIPGPNSTEMAIHIGYRRAGVRGLLLAGSCFILPAALMVTAIGWAYMQYGKLPQVAGILYGVKPVVIAVIIQALWRLGRAAIKTRLLAVAAIIATAINALGVDELIVLFGIGILVAIVEQWMANPKAPPSAAAALPMTLPSSPTTAMAAAAGVAVPVGLWPLFLIFLKIGAVLFGSGYVLLAFLRADLVQHLHWLTESQLLDATAVGQVTPGPVFTTATFIGYILAGWRGAVIATVGIFLPAFFFVAISAPFMPRLRKSKWAGSFLDGLNVASLALMAVVTWDLGRGTLIDWPSWLMAIFSAIVLLTLRVNSVWLVLAGAGMGAILAYGHAIHL